MIRREGRTPTGVVHDHGSHFRGQFARALGVLGIEAQVTPTGLPSMNCYAERAVGSVRRELLRYIRAADAADVQGYLDDYRRYANRDRAHQGLNGRTPAEVAGRVELPDLLEAADLRHRHLERRHYARGLLRGYTLAANDVGPLGRAA